MKKDGGYRNYMADKKHQISRKTNSTLEKMKIIIQFWEFTSVGCYVVLLSDAVAIATLEVGDEPLGVGAQNGAVDAADPELPQLPPTRQTQHH